MNFVYCMYTVVLYPCSTLTQFIDFCGTIIGAPVVPVILTVLWRKLTNTAVLVGCLGGTGLALISWLVTCRYYYGSLNVTNLVSDYSSLAGSTTSLGSGAIISIVLSLIKPDNYDFTGTRSST